MQEQERHRIDKAARLMTRLRILRLMLPLGFLWILSCAAHVMATTSTADVLASLGPTEGAGFAATIDSAHLSFSHGIRIRFRVKGHGQFSGAYWRLWPFREVVGIK